MRSLLLLAALACCLAVDVPPPPPAPASFCVKITMSDQGLTVNKTVHWQVERKWSPHGVDRFHQLVSLGYYNANAYFRVVPNFVVQFGINGDPATSHKWENANIQDDPVIIHNLPGTVAFADAGPNTRTTQLFVNLKDNSFLDHQGFTPFAKVLGNGLNDYKMINAQYGQHPNQAQIYADGNAYLKKSFPKLDYMWKCEVAACPAL
eukprot:NODE_1930_length_694_cov_65.139330_g1880_i0.p1 GENE.NODE_1930_length_694_cov_65.139330_g1880_i0~~NODE_1930_length_694_cov_65.139330_g1880_i0.p1  ORF type:complete len:206 (+),score=36.70 NODE_1930_length_694_cov_65.139330_g1880_i0:58-675(+)